MSDYKQTREAAGNVTSQYSQMLRNLDDDLVERLNDRRVCSPAQNSCRNDHVLNQAEARIEELEAKLARAVEDLERIGSGEFSGQMLTSMPPQDAAAYFARTTLAELKGETGE